MEKYSSFAFFTMLIIHLQAAKPDTNAVREPMMIEREEVPEEAAEKSPPTKFKNASPKMGMSTMRNENCATELFFTPHRSPVEMVAPERESPGRTAMAWATPMITASL